MAGRIPQAFLDDLLFRTDIVELIDQRVPLKRAGKNYTACCPFHNEKTPSFSVSPDKQFYYCFGCGATGNAVGFLMEYDRYSFPEGVEYLASRAGVTVPQETDRREDNNYFERLKPLYAVLEQSSSFFQQQLKESRYSGKAKEYLKSRGMTGRIARDFGIGYAPPGWDNLLSFELLADQKEALVGSGMLIRKEDENKLYDRFRDRIMFPIRNLKGSVIGFGGRVMGDDKPKYLNSPETPVFHKGKELYGLYEIKKLNSKLDKILVVEGYMDVIMLAQYGITNAVATLGTAVSTDHLEKLFRQVPEVIFCFDGDKAGKNAALRALETVLPLMNDGRQAGFLFLPEGHDPDSLVQEEGKELFDQRVSECLQASDFLYQTASVGLNLESADGKARLGQVVKPYLAKLPKGLYREMLMNRLAELMGLPLEAVMQHLGDVVAPPPLAESEQTQLPASGQFSQVYEEGPLENDYGSSAEPWYERDSISGDKPAEASVLAGKSSPLVDKVIRLLLQNPDLARAGEWPDLTSIELPYLDLLQEVKSFFIENPQASYALLLGKVHDSQEGQHLIKLLEQENLVEGDSQLEFLEGTLKQFEKVGIEQAIEQEEKLGIPNKEQYMELLRKNATLHLKK